MHCRQSPSSEITNGGGVSLSAITLLTKLFLLKISKSKTQKISKRIEYLISRVLDVDKRKIMAVEDLSLLNSEEKHSSSTANLVRFSCLWQFVRETI